VIFFFGKFSATSKATTSATHRLSEETNEVKTLEMKKKKKGKKKLKKRGKGKKS